MVDRSRTDGLGEPFEALASGQTHPMDTHPPGIERARRLGVLPDAALLAEASRPISDEDLQSVAALFRDWPALVARYALAA